MQGIFKVECWGGPMDGRLLDIQNPTESLRFPCDSLPEVTYDFSYQLPTKVLLYKLRKEVRV